jgi:hypothetical protein
MHIISGFFVLLWLAITIYTFIGAIGQLIEMNGTAIMKIAYGLTLVGSWLVAQFFSILFVFKSSYCENCSGNPITGNDVFMYLIFISPSLIAFILLRSYIQKKNDANP